MGTPSPFCCFHVITFHKRSFVCFRFPNSFTLLHNVVVNSPEVVPQHNFVDERSYSSYSFTTSALDGVSGQRHTPAVLYPRGKDPPSRTHCTGGWVGPRAGLDTEVREEILFLLLEIEPRLPGRPVRTQTRQSEINLCIKYEVQSRFLCFFSNAKLRHHKICKSPVYKWLNCVLAAFCA
jgi:hypothetical protein